MTWDRVAIGSVLTASAALALGYVAWDFVALSAWTPAFPGLLTALSLMAGAVLVRLARNAPITSPTTFDEQDLNRFFDSLEMLSHRLLWVFVQCVLAIFLVISSIVVGSLSPQPDIVRALIGPFLSALLSALLVWLVWRLLLMARGDIGFLRLQRQIIENALKRDKAKEIDKLLKQPVLLRSVNEYGRQI